jgi:hypothetical protein
MPESPDFEKIAREIDRVVTEYARTTLDLPDPVPVIIDQLRLVWNARGAADLAKLEADFPGTVTKMIDRALRSLDR